MSSPLMAISQVFAGEWPTSAGDLILALIVRAEVPRPIWVMGQQMSSKVFGSPESPLTEGLRTFVLVMTDLLLVAAEDLR